MTDIRLQQAREHQRAADQARESVTRHLAQRDALIRSLYAEGTWSYGQLAKALALTPELIAKIIRPQPRGSDRVSRSVGQNAVP